MGWWLASDADRVLVDSDWVKRFDPRFWTVNFPRPMMAAVTTTAPDAMRVDCAFYKRNDLAGLIWESVDRFDHPLLKYETSRDYRGCVLRFRWRSEGAINALNAVYGPTLTIEGRDAEGAARTWYVRLWNYADGSGDDAVVTLDFDALQSGFSLPGEAVWAGDVDRLFVSLSAPGYDGADAPLGARADATVFVEDLRCDGPGSVLAIGDAMAPPHSLRIAGGYDDCYHLTPARVLRNAVQLGYRDWFNHYVGMSHYFEMAWNGSAFVAGGGLNGPAAAWHADFAARCKVLGYKLILSVSYELLDQHCPEGWKQRHWDGSPALTGWEPPSTLLSPASADAMTWLRGVALDFAGIAEAAGLDVRVQIGEPWWWVGGDHAPCIYDAAAVAAYGDAPEIADVRGALSEAQGDYLDWLGGVLGESTLALRDAVRDAYPDAQVLLLFYAPQVLASEGARRLNLPAAWEAPAFDVLQLEDYDFVIGGDVAGSARAAEAVTAGLGYAADEQHYFSGFVLDVADRGGWRAIADSVGTARGRRVAEGFVWALPQVMRDGFLWFENGEDAVQAFHDVRFPIEVGLGASGGPAFSTTIVTGASGAEQRNSAWADARMQFDAGLGVRSEADLAAVAAFFRARRGAAIGFRFRDPADFSSHGATGAPGAGDQAIGTGDGVATRFALVKRYGDADEAQVRRVTRPEAGSVRVAVGGVERLTGWTLAAGGFVDFAAAPASGAAVTAGFRFDVPVRFGEDRLEISGAAFAAGELPSVPLVEISES